MELPEGEGKVALLKIVMPASYDFFGRVTLYNLDILGEI